MKRLSKEELEKIRFKVQECGLALPFAEKLLSHIEAQEKEILLLKSKNAHLEGFKEGGE